METLLKKGSPSNSLPKTFNDFSGMRHKTSFLKNVRSVRKERSRKNFSRNYPHSNNSYIS